MAYRAIFGVQVHADDQILVVRLNGIREPFRVALERGVQRRLCDPPLQSGGLAIRVRRYEAYPEFCVLGIGRTFQTFLQDRATVLANRKIHHVLMTTDGSRWTILKMCLTPND